MLRTERQQQGVLGGRGLQLEVELAAEAFAQRQRPRAGDSAAEGRVQHQLHPAGLVEEALEHQRLLRRNDAKRALAFREVGNHLFGGARRQPGFSGQPRDGSRGFRVPGPGGRLPGGRRPLCVDIRAEVAHRSRQLVASCRRLAQPEGNRGRRTVGIRHANRACGHAQDLPGGVAELKDVARHALDREVLVDRADERLVRFEHHAVVGDLGNRTARRQGEQPRCPPGAQRGVDLVAMDERRPSPAGVAKPSASIATTASKSPRASDL